MASQGSLYSGVVRGHRSGTAYRRLSSRRSDRLPHPEKLYNGPHTTQYLQRSTERQARDTTILEPNQEDIREHSHHHTTKDAPIRTFVAALVSYRLIFGDKPERLEPIFEVPGFLKDFAAFQRSLLEGDDKNWYPPICSREDPRVRGFHEAGVARKEFHICSFHVHEDRDTCSSVSNYETVVVNNRREDDGQRYCLEHGEM